MDLYTWKWWRFHTTRKSEKPTTTLRAKPNVLLYASVVSFRGRHDRNHGRSVHQCILFTWGTAAAAAGGGGAGCIISVKYRWLAAVSSRCSLHQHADIGMHVHAYSVTVTVTATEAFILRPRPEEQEPLLLETNTWNRWTKLDIPDFYISVGGMGHSVCHER